MGEGTDTRKTIVEKLQKEKILQTENSRVCVCAGTLVECGIGAVIRQDIKSSWRQISGRACEEVSRSCLLRWEDPP